MAEKPKPNPKEVRKGCGFLIVIVSIPILCFYIFCGEEKSSVPKNGYTAADTLKALTSVIHESVTNYLQQNLADFKSYEPILWGEPTELIGGSYMIRHKYRAKNSLGNYAIADQFFMIDGTGIVVGVKPFD